MTSQRADTVFRKLLDLARSPTVQHIDPGFPGWLERQKPGILRMIREAMNAQNSPPIVIEYVDFFKLTDAPHVWEERLSDSGRSYSVKVYLPEAYTSDYMSRSDETGRLVRWGVRLADGRAVSRDGIFRLRDPKGWAKLRAKLERARGDRREEIAAAELWKLLSPEEREAMLRSLDLTAYADARGIDQAQKDVVADLKASGSLLYWLQGELRLYDRLADAYAEKFLGGPISSSAWSEAPWGRWVVYKTTRAGVPVEDVDPSRLPLTSEMRTTGRTGVIVRRRPHPWWGSLSEFARNGHRDGEVRRLREILTGRLGGPFTFAETESVPEFDAVRRRERLAEIDARVARMAPADQAEVKTDRYKLVPAMLSALSNLRSAR